MPVSEYSDTGISFVLGKGDEMLHKLCQSAESAFQKGLLQARAGKKQNQIGRAVYNLFAKKEQSGFKTKKAPAYLEAGAVCLLSGIRFRCLRRIRF